MPELFSTSANGPANCVFDVFAGYHFTNPDLLAEALHAKDESVTIGERYAAEGNRRLALLGDTVLTTALVTQWYHSYQTRNAARRGWLDYMISNKNLSRIAMKFEIDRHCIRPEGVPFHDLNETDRASTVEALIGAVYLDCEGSLKKVKQVLDVLGLRCPDETERTLIGPSTSSVP